MGALSFFKSNIVGINTSQLGSRKGHELTRIENGNITPILERNAIIPRHVSPDMVVKEEMIADAMKLQAQHVKRFAGAKQTQTEAAIELHSTHAEHQQGQMKAQQVHAKTEVDHMQHSIHHVQQMGEYGMTAAKRSNQLSATAQLYSNMLEGIGF